MSKTSLLICTGHMARARNKPLVFQVTELLGMFVTEAEPSLP